MLISASFLGVKEDKKENILKLGNSEIDYLHVDVMDGQFVPNETESFESLKRVLPLSIPLDVHLMVEDMVSYIEEYSILRPKYITIHVENNGILSAIDLIKSKNIKVGLSIKPDTPINKVIPYLPIVDMILVMSVEPGKGGQSFIEDSTKKIEQLYTLREKQGYNYVIEVDGGINNETIKLCDKADIVVVGSYITKQNYEEAIRSLRN